MDGEILLDLCYDEDFRASVDMNVVASSSGEIVEFQATAEEGTVPLDVVSSMGEMALRAIRTEILPLQMEASGE